MKIYSTADANGAVTKIELRDEKEAMELVAALAKTLTGGLTVAGTFKDDTAPQRIDVLINRFSKEQPCPKISS